MAFKIVIKEVNVESVVKGKSRYQVANVSYTYNGDAKTQKIMSFSNPDVFKKVQEFVGKEVSVETVESNGYKNWSKLELVADAPNSGAAPGRSVAPGQVISKSTYETPEERKVKQLYIIRQSSITNAINRAAQHPDPNSIDVLALAQMYVDFVYGPPEDLFDHENDLGDVPA
jgi:hypothetical protein